MSKDTLLRQADRADNIADQAVDDDMIKILRDAANDYREHASREADDSGVRIPPAD